MYQWVCKNCFKICTRPNFLIGKTQSQTQVLAFHWHQHKSKYWVKGQPGPNDHYQNLLKVNILSTFCLLSPRRKSLIMLESYLASSRSKEGIKLTLLSQFVFGTAFHQLLCSRVKRHCLHGQIDGKSVFKPKHYLLYNMRELLALYNEEYQEVETTYYQMHSIIAKE